MWKDRAAAGAHPFQFTLSPDVERVVTSLRSYDRDSWAEVFSAAAAPYRTAAEDAEQAGDTAAAQRNYLRAYGYYRLARYPTTNSDAKVVAYRQSQDMLLRASRYFTVPIERVEIPFRGRAGEGDRIVGYLRVPESDRRLPILIISGGIDTFKEDIPRDGVLDRRIATLALDIPKVAHTHRDRLACVVSHGGCVHHAFEPDWTESAQRGEYPFELAETLAYAFGHNTFDEWVEYAPQLSLLRQGILDQPCTETLVVNGLHDSVFPISDCYLLLERGTPKSARFFDAAHMGYTRDTDATIIDWIASRLHI